MKAIRPLAWVALVLLVGVTACGGEGGDAQPSELIVDSETCPSGSQWVGGNEGSPLMHPGENCMRCHLDNDAPVFDTAATVYLDTTAVPDDDCLGVEGATVRLEDAGGQVVELTTNAAGNFYLPIEEAPAWQLPLTATVTYQGRSHTMNEPIYNLNCADCHDGSTASAHVPPRITVPAPQ